MKKITFNVKGMHCGSCEELVKDSLEEEKGVDHASLSWKNGTAAIRYDDERISISQLKSIIQEEGYEVLE